MQLWPVAHFFSLTFGWVCYCFPEPISLPDQLLIISYLNQNKILKIFLFSFQTMEKYLHFRALYEMENCLVYTSILKRPQSQGMAKSLSWFRSISKWQIHWKASSNFVASWCMEISRKKWKFTLTQSKSMRASGQFFIYMNILIWIF